MIKHFLFLTASVALLFAAGNGISFTNTDIRDVVKALSVAHNVNIIVDQDVDMKITIYVQELPLPGILDALTKSYNLGWVKEGDMYRIQKTVEEQALSITIKADTIKQMTVKNTKIKDFIDELSKKASISVLAEKGLKGKLSGTLKDVPLREGLKTFFEANGYSLNKKGDVFVIALGDNAVDEEGGKQAAKREKKSGKFDIDIEDGKLNMSLTGADLGEVLKEIADQANMNIITYDQVKASVDAKLTNIPVQEAIERILAGTKYTYTIDKGILLVGEKNATTPSGEALSMSKLLHLKHIKAEGIPALLPKSIPSGNVQVIKEQNGILVMGTQVIIKQVEEFLNEIDVPTPQISIEAIIVEFYTDNMKDIGLKAGSKSTTDTSSLSGSYIPGLSITADRHSIEKGTGFKFGSIGILPDNFNITLHALETDKMARVLARPKIATLNGYKASINVGNSSYYKITTGNFETPLSRFQEINSGIKLDITPWISKGGQITAEIAPEVSNAGALNTENYPDISRRTMSTTVRLNDGETIVIGGLIQGEQRETIERVPFLGKIPFLGWFFRTKLKSEIKSELLIYVTPHIITEKDYVNLEKERVKWSTMSKDSLKTGFETMEDDSADVRKTK
ncbi:MAG: secretin and TonB N-terminal domain-containing protein [Fibrobacterota bacterium]